MVVCVSLRMSSMIKKMGVATINSAPQDTQYFALGDDGFPQLWQFRITIHLLIFYQYIFEPLHTFHP